VAVAFSHSKTPSPPPPTDVKGDNQLVFFIREKAAKWRIVSSSFFSPSYSLNIVFFLKNCVTRLTVLGIADG
jgi:hypothetical protein